MGSVGWTKSSSGAWTTAANWSSGLVPGAADDVTIHSAGSTVVTYAGLVSTIDTIKLQSATLAIAGGALTVAGDATFNGPVVLSGGTLTLGGSGGGTFGPFTQTGGRLVLRGSSFLLSGNASLGGAITGSGRLGIFSHTTTLAAGVKLSMAVLDLFGGFLKLGVDTTYGGNFWQSGGYVDTGTHTLTLSGAADLGPGFIVGTGHIVSTGSLTLDQIQLGGGVTLSVAGLATQINDLVIGTGSASTAALVVQSGATYTLGGGNEIDTAALTGSHLVNNGTLLRTGGSGLAEINVAVTNTGVVEGRAGDLQFLQPFGGAGTVRIDSGALVGFENTVASATGMAFEANGVLRLGAGAEGYAGTISGFTTGDAIDLTAFDPTKTTKGYNATTHVLTLSDGSNIAHLHFAAGLSAADFVLGAAPAGVGVFHA